MSRVTEEIDFLVAASAELDDYLSSNVMFWPLKTTRKKLTPGNLLLAHKRIRAIKDLANFNPAFEKAENLIEKVISTRRSAWQKKASEELEVRLRLWKSTLEEYLEDGVIDGTYPAQITNRVLIDLLGEESNLIQMALERELSRVDESLKRIINDGLFIWEPEFAEAFPKLRFWYLYQGMGEVEK